MFMRNGVKLGVATVRTLPRAADVEARGVEGVLMLMLFVPRIPHKAMVAVRDAYFALAAMSDGDLAKPWQPFRRHFIRERDLMMRGL